MANNKQPLGIELVRLGVVTQDDVQKALEYQTSHPGEKIGDILYKLKLTDPTKLIEAIGQVLDEKALMLEMANVKLNIEEYISLDTARNALAVPFEISGGTIKVCFASIANNSQIESIRLLMLNRGLIMDRYITFKECIINVLDSLESRTAKLSTDLNATTLVDNIIREGMKKRASDIHFEPMEDGIRIRYRIDGILVNVAKIDADKQDQIVGRLKSISNMHQEVQTSQDGRITMYPDYNIRASSQRTIYGEKFVLRLLIKNQIIKGLHELGYPNDPKLMKEAFDKRNSVTVISAPTGEGKTTTLYSAISYLNKPGINITTIEDPVEIRIPGLNQIEIDTRTSFANSLRTVLRQDPDIILVGEIRDNETAEIAMQAGQTGHYVLSTIHTINAIETIARLRKMDISNYDISSTLATSISQRLVRKLCPKCRKERPFNDEEKEIIKKIADKYHVEFDTEKHHTYDPVGCKECNNSGFYDRIAVFETLIFTDAIKELVVNNASTLDIRKQALEEGYLPLVVDGIKKVIEGVTTLEELNSKLLFY